MELIGRIRNVTRLIRRSRFHYYRAAVVRPPFWLWMKGRLYSVAAANEPGAVSCYTEVAVEDCYEIYDYARRNKPKVIVDIGANLGMFSKVCSILFPHTNIYAYEPHPAALVWLRQNAVGTMIRVMPWAVSEQAGVVKLDTACDSTNASIQDHGDLSVDCVGCSDVAEGKQIDFLKMDCEGHEWSILKNRDLLSRTKEFCVAYHLHGRPLAELRWMVESAGHRIVRTVHTKGNGQYGMLRSVLEAASSETATAVRTGSG